MSQISQRLHVPVVWSELFFDLVVACAMLLIYGGLAKHVSWGNLLWYGGVSLMVFAIWTSMVLISNRLPSDTWSRRLLAIALMILLVYAVASMERTPEVDGDSGIVALGLSLLVLSLAWWQTYRHAPIHVVQDRLPAIWALVGGAFLTSSALLPDRYNEWIFAIGALIGLLPVFVVYVPQIRHSVTFVASHLAERMGQLVLIMLGETFLELAVLFNNGASPRTFGVILVLITVAIVWWQYIYVVNPLEFRSSGVRLDLYFLGHALLVLGIGSSAVALTQVALQTHHPLSTQTLALMLASSMATTYLGMCLVVAPTRRPIRLLTILVLTTLALAVVGVFMHYVITPEQVMIGLVTGAIMAICLLATGFASGTFLPKRPLSP